MNHTIDGLVMLCQHGEIPTAGYPMISEPKLDGFRMAFYIDDACNVTVSSRAGSGKTGNTNPYTANLKHISDALVELGFRSCMVDGEIGAASWNEVAKLARLKNPTETQMGQIRSKIFFNAFDVVYDMDLETYHTSRGKQVRCAKRSLVKRRQDLEILVPAKHPIVVLVPQTIVHSTEEVLAAHRQYLAHGFEGSVLKQPHSTYEFDRSHQWVACKPVETIDGVIIEFIPGEGKHVGRLGAIRCRMEDGSEVSFGTGYTDAEREDIWARRDELMGQWLEGTKQGSGAAATARHPVFQRIRGRNKE